jgi:hypothetical protein
MTTTVTETKYFQLVGEATVLQLDENGWTRWDRNDGLVPSRAGLDENSSSLKRISLDEAINLMK